MEIEFVCAGCGEECLICDLETEVTLTHCAECANKRISELEFQVAKLRTEKEDNYQLACDWEKAHAEANKHFHQIADQRDELQRKYDALVDGLKAEIQLAEDDAVYFEREAESGEVEVYKLRALLEDE